MKTVAEVIGVCRSNLVERLQQRPPRRIGRPPLPDEELVAQIKTAIAELPTYGYRRVHAILKRQAVAAGLKPPNHKRVYRVFQSLLENLGLQGLLAEQPMKLANLVLQRPIIRRRHHLLAAAGCGQAALRYQSAPREQLVWRNAVLASHQAHRHPRREGLLDHSNLLGRGPTPAALNRRNDLNAIRRVGHRHGCMPHTC